MPTHKKLSKLFKAGASFVVKDLFLTETTKLADYIIPAASYLEREEMFSSTGFSERDSSLGKYIDNGLQTEYEFFKGLADRMGAGSYFPWKDDHALNEWLLEPTGYNTADLHTAPGGFVFGASTHMKSISSKRPPARRKCLLLQRESWSCLAHISTAKTLRGSTELPSTILLIT